MYPLFLPDGPYLGLALNAGPFESPTAYAGPFESSKAFRRFSSRALSRMSDLLSPLRHEPDLLCPFRLFYLDAPPDSLLPVVVPPLRPPA